MECHYCDALPVVRARLLADPEDIAFDAELCAYHWRYVQLLHRRLSYLQIMECEAINGRDLTIPDWGDWQALPSVDAVWPAGRMCDK